LIDLKGGDPTASLMRNKRKRRFHGKLTKSIHTCSLYLLTLKDGLSCGKLQRRNEK